MKDFDGILWKHQTNPACTKRVRVSKMLKLDTVRKQKKTTAYGCYVQNQRLANDSKNHQCLYSKWTMQRKPQLTNFLTGFKQWIKNDPGQWNWPAFRFYGWDFRENNQGRKHKQLNTEARNSVKQGKTWQQHTSTETQHVEKVVNSQVLFIGRY